MLLVVTTMHISYIYIKKGKRKNTQESVDINLRYQHLKGGSMC